ncbi:MAG: SH3 domain-containing protein [Aggregatilineales bacterium]
MKRTATIAACALLLALLGLALTAQVQAQAQFGTNWTGVFYNNTNFQGAAVATVTGINGLNFNWPNQPVINAQTLTAVNADNFTARFTSTQVFTPGRYRFTVTYDDGVVVLIDNQQVLNEPPAGLRTSTFERDMTGTHSFQVDFTELTAAAVLQFQWEPAGALAPEATPIPPLTASVSGVRGLAVRTGPYLGASLVTVAVPGEQYPVLAQNPSEQGVTWYKITVNGRTGWSSGRFLTFTTDPSGLPLEGSVFDTLDNPPDTGVIVVPRAFMNLRPRPTTRLPILADIPWGAELPLLGRTVQGGQNRWFQVRYGDQVGWIFAPYVSVRGNINAVPVH